MRVLNQESDSVKALSPSRDWWKRTVWQKPTEVENFWLKNVLYVVASLRTRQCSDHKWTLKVPNPQKIIKEVNVKKKMSTTSWNWDQTQHIITSLEQIKKLAAKSVGLRRSEPHGDLNVTVLAGPGVAVNNYLFGTGISGVATARWSTEQATGNCHPPALLLHSLPWDQVTLTEEDWG